MDEQSRTAYLTTRELATLLAVTAATVKRWRREGVGPTWVRVGAAVRYEQQDVDAWLAENRNRSTRRKQS